VSSQLKSGGAVVGGASRQGSLSEQRTLVNPGLSQPVRQLRNSHLITQPAAEAAITGTGGVTFQVPALAATGLEKFTATGAEIFAHPTLAGTGAEKFVATGSETFRVPAIAGSGTNLLAITGTGAVAFQVPALSGGEAPIVEIASSKFPLLVPRRSKHLAPYRKPKRPVVVHPKAPALVVNNQAALVALYAAGALNEEELAALLAA
jgi:hypothetical protein